MADLALSTDIVARLGRALTAQEALRIVPILKDASSVVRNYTGQEFTAGTSTAKRLRVRRGTVTLPQRPVTAVSAVVSSAGEPVLYQWDGFDTIATSGNVPDAWAWVPFTGLGSRVVDVTYTHGYAAIPDDIINVVCAIAIRALGRKPEDSALASESIAGYSYSVREAGMLTTEREILDGYKRAGGVIYTGGF